MTGRKLRMGFVLDVVGYGARLAPLRSDVQRRLPRLVSAMLLQCGLALENVEHEWTGDGINVVMPADADPTVALPVLLRALATLLGEDNARSDDRMRLRMSVGIGLVENSTAGFGGPMIIEMSRMVNSAALRSALAAYPRADLVAAISDQVHSVIIRPGYPGIPGTQFTRVDVAEKEFRAPAWIWVSARQWTVPAYGPLSKGDPRLVGRPNTDRYRLAARLAVSRASAVYLALAADGTRLAVKAFRREALAEGGQGGQGGQDGESAARARLAAGVRVAAMVRGPRTAMLVDADPDAASPWVATLLVPGPSLDAVITQTGPLPPESVLWLAAGMARGLADVHMAGLAHRSLRPSNVLLGPDGPVLTDVGTCWPAISDAPAAGQPRAAGGHEGTATDLIAEGLDADEDILALGCVAFFAATGRSPYGERLASGEHLPQGTEAADLADCPAGLLPIVVACLLPPAQRPSAKALLAMVEAAAGLMPRDWLPQVVTDRFADYQALPDSSGAGRQPRSWLPRLAGMAKRRRQLTNRARSTGAIGCDYDWTEPRPHRLAIPRRPAHADGTGAALPVARPAGGRGGHPVRPQPDRLAAHWRRVHRVGGAGHRPPLRRRLPGAHRGHRPVPVRRELGGAVRDSVPVLRHRANGV
jgi:hypothetical protein